MNLLYCGFGLSEGEVIQGNIGSTIKMDYTVLGDTVNLAAQLEALTRTIRRALALSEPVQQSAKGSWPFTNVGQLRCIHSTIRWSRNSRISRN
jgi:class 3 adenylate cyclase